MLVNGLTQYAELWGAYRDALVAKAFRVATFDLLGQGASDKPALFISQDDQVAALRLLIDQLGDGPVFLGGISFGGLIALRYAIEHGDRLAGLVPMSTFAELSPQLLLLGNALRTGLILGGTSYLQDLLLPMNLSDAWLEPQLGNLEAIKRQGWLINDVYALQNLMESFLDFKPLTPQLSSISDADDDPERRVRFPDPARTARNLAPPYSRQRARHHSTRLSRLHARKAGADGRPALAGSPRMFSPGNGRATARSGSLRRSRRRDHPLPRGLRSSARHSGAEARAMSMFLGPLDAAGRVPPRQQTRVAAFLISCSWRAGATACDRPALQLKSGLADGIERAALSRSRNRLAAAAGDLLDTGSGTAVSRFSWEAAWLPKPVDGIADRTQASDRSISRRSAMPCMRAIRPAALLPLEAAAQDPFALALRRIEFESGRLMQAQILFLKSADLLPFRDAVTAAVERRHAQVRELWHEMLAGIGVHAIARRNERRLAAQVDP